MIDDFNREALAIEIDFSLPTARIIQALDAHRACAACDRDQPFLRSKRIDAATARAPMASTTTSTGNGLDHLSIFVVRP